MPEARAVRVTDALSDKAPFVRVHDGTRRTRRTRCPRRVMRDTRPPADVRQSKRGARQKIPRCRRLSVPAHGSITLRERWRAAGSDLGANDPPPLRDLPYPREAVLRIQLLRSCVQIGATLRRPLLGLLRIGFDDAATGPLDLVECRRDRSGGDALAAVFRVGEDAADPPVRRIVGPPVVGAPVVDIGEFRRRAELAPADAVVTRRRRAPGGPFRASRADASPPGFLPGCGLRRRPPGGIPCTSSHPTRRC